MKEGRQGGSWDRAWDEVFRTRRWGRYPPEELIRFMARNFFSVEDRSKVRVLELGCGAGACTWFLAREGFDTYAVDGSDRAVELTEKYLRSESLSAHVAQADFVNLDFEAEFFDAVVEVASIQQTMIDKVRIIIKKAWELLRPGGAMFAMMVAKGTWGDGLGEGIEPNTFTNIPEGPYEGLGVTHFFEEGEIVEVFSAFAEVELEKSTRTAGNRTHEIGHWVVSARK